MDGSGACLAASIVAIVIGSAFVIWYTYYARRKPDPIEEARRADMFARGWTPLDEDVHFPPAWFAKISKLRTVGSEMPHTTWGKDGWITFNYDVMQFISDANPSYGTDIVFLVCPCTVPRGPLMWATIYQGRKMFQRTSEQGGMPADVVELLKMSPYRPNLIVMDGRIYIWLRVNYMPLPQRFSELSAGKRSDSVDEGTASQARPRYGDCRPDAVGWPRLSGHRYGDWSNSVLKCAPRRQVRAHRDAKHPICVPMCAESSVRRALKDANGTTALRNNPYRPGDAAGNGYFAASAGVSSSSSLAMTSS